MKGRCPARAACAAAKRGDAIAKPHPVDGQISATRTERQTMLSVEMIHWRRPARRRARTLELVVDLDDALDGPARDREPDSLGNGHVPGSEIWTLPIRAALRRSGVDALYDPRGRARYRWTFRCWPTRYCATWRDARRSLEALGSRPMTRLFPRLALFTRTCMRGVHLYAQTLAIRTAIARVARSAGPGRSR